MKSIKILAVSLIAAIGLNSCASSWLDQELTGGALSQEEYNTMTNSAEGNVRGLYAQLYTYGNCGSGHDAFGQKTIDLVSDLTSLDMSMNAEAYGWFVMDAHRQLDYRSPYFWPYFFSIIMNSNAVMRGLDKKSALTDDDKASYAQALAMRAYSYYTLANLYEPTVGSTQRSLYGKNGIGAEYDLAPIYTPNDTTDKGLVKEQPLSTLIQVREFVRKDLLDAIEMFDEIGFKRDSKLYIDGDLARALLAYNYLQMAWLYPSDGGDYTAEQCYKEAYKYATEVIDGGKYQIMQYDDVLTTGFVNVQDKSWMWGLDVTPENYTGLASFWGHMDIHTYSYAFAGATKGCDQILYDSIPETDIRKQWFNAKKKYIPDWKFYDLARGETADEIDRDWKNDIVYMRIEEMYLIAAEAAARIGDVANAQKMLKCILDERFETPVDFTKYYDGDLKMQIYYNWRIEMWGEGRSLITWKRFANDGEHYVKKFRGSNHYSKTPKELKSTEFQYTTYIMPSSEAVYNNEIAD